MESVSSGVAWRETLRPWLLILMTAPLILIAGFLLANNWRATQETRRTADRWVQRQNKVLAHDAKQVADGFADFLALAARDVRLLADLPESNSARFSRFFQGLNRGFSSARASSFFPFYNRMAVFQRGQLALWGDEGRQMPVQNLSQCQVIDLCDRVALETAAASAKGVTVGKAMRWYTPQTSSDVAERGSLSVVYKNDSGVYLLGIDFRSIAQLMLKPTFPYEERGDLVREYEEGNYIYILDRDTDLLAHPRRSHRLGFDPRSGKPVPPMETDAEAGIRPLNFRAYREGKLRPYFDRLIERSFQGTDVDVFQAANLSGQIRVISIAPIVLDPKIFSQSVFGWVGVGCALEEFEEPEQKPVPYF